MGKNTVIQALHIYKCMYAHYPDCSGPIKQVLYMCASKQEKYKPLLSCFLGQSQAMPPGQPSHSCIASYPGRPWHAADTLKYLLNLMVTQDNVCHDISQIMMTQDKVRHDASQIMMMQDKVSHEVHI